MEIRGVSNITLQGLGDVEQGFHETILQSTSVIMCGDNRTTGTKFTSSTDVAKISLTITNCRFYTYFRLHGGGSFEFSNCAIYNNSALKYGGGVFIDTYGTSSIEYHNCTLYNNSAWYDRGRVYIDLYEGVGRIEYDNCSVFKNKSLNDEGGVYTDFYKEVVVLIFVTAQYSKILHTLDQKCIIVLFMLR